MVEASPAMIAFYRSQRSETRRQAVVATTAAVLLVGLGVVAFLVDAIIPVVLKGTVGKAVAVWENPAAPNGWVQFKELNAYAVITPSSGGSANNSTDCSALSQTILLEAAACPEDQYFEGADRFQSVKQLSFCAATTNWSVLQRCNMQVSFQIQQPGHDGPTTLITISNAVGPAGRVKVELGKIKRFGCSPPSTMTCSGEAYDTCFERCEDTFDGSISCDGLCNTRHVYVSSLAIKVQYNSGALPPFYLDTKSPAMGPDGWGANILPHGYTWTKPGASALSGPMWTYEGMSYGEPPSSLLLQIRSSSDPYLAYLAATKGNGSFDGLDTVFIMAAWLVLGMGFFTALPATAAWSEFFSIDKTLLSPSTGVPGAAGNTKETSPAAPTQVQDGKSVAIAMPEIVKPPPGPATYMRLHTTDA